MQTKFGCKIKSIYCVARAGNKSIKHVTWSDGVNLQCYKKYLHQWNSKPAPQPGRWPAWCHAGAFRNVCSFVTSKNTNIHSSPCAGDWHYLPGAGREWDVTGEDNHKIFSDGILKCKLNLALSRGHFLSPASAHIISCFGPDQLLRCKQDMISEEFQTAWL